LDVDCGKTGRGHDYTAQPFADLPHDDTLAGSSLTSEKEKPSVASASKLQNTVDGLALLGREVDRLPAASERRWARGWVWHDFR
jgi:hypothetical protein